MSHPLMRMTPYLLTLLAAFVFSAYITVPLAKRAAARFGAIDQPGELKVHARAIPRFGGFGILLTILLAVLVLSFLGHDFRPEVAIASAGALLIALIGFWDDAAGLSQTIKFALEGIVALGLALFWPQALPWWGVIVVCIWLIGLVNGYNFIDGLDGLAGGIFSINLIALAVLFFLSGASASALLALACAGACLGFLRHNWQPASIFLGDGGALGLGFLIGGLSLVYVQAGGYAFNRIIAVLLTAAPPVADVALTLIRRLVGRRSLRPGELFAGDRAHFYDQMRANAGMTVRSTVLASYGAAASLACLGVVVHFRATAEAIIIALGGLGVLILFAVTFKIGIPRPERTK
jgi:UDP-GlcNAc:undecaprenyl-phosphate GlcNAc-1-phosphate transferase